MAQKATNKEGKDLNNPENLDNQAMGEYLGNLIQKSQNGSQNGFERMGQSFTCL